RERRDARYQQVSHSEQSRPRLAVGRRSRLTAGYERRRAANHPILGAPHPIRPVSQRKVLSAFVVRSEAMVWRSIGWPAAALVAACAASPRGAERRHVPVADPRAVVTVPPAPSASAALSASAIAVPSVAPVDASPVPKPT